MGSKKPQRADWRRTEILAGASSAIRRLGLRRAGMRQIADAAGLSIGNLYYYFRNKEELVYFCQDRTLDALLEVVKEAEREERPALRVAALIRGHLRVLLDARAAGAVHLEFDGLPPPLYRKLVQKRDRYERGVRALVAEGMRSGGLRRGDPKLATFALLGALNWAARWFRPGGAYSIDEVAAGFVDQLLGGLLPNNGVRGRS